MEVVSLVHVTKEEHSVSQLQIYRGFSKGLNTIGEKEQLLLLFLIP